MTRNRVLAQSIVVFLVAGTAVLPAFAPALAQGGARDTTLSTRRDTLESVVVRATRAPAAGASARTTLTRDDLLRTSTGQDAPLVMLGTPSISAYSESGAYSGYSYVRFRGLDQTRLNITVDGVPLNDPEDQVLYFSNVPDFLGSISTVEIGRGVGASTFGTAAFAGSMNFQSVPLATTPRGGHVELSGGSFETWRASTQGATGVGANGMAAYGRLTRQGTAGYRDHSGNDAWSGFGSVGWFRARDAFKITALGGSSGTRLAYYAASEEALAIRRDTNPLTASEGDRFHQEMISAQYSRSIRDGLEGMLLIYRNSAAGAYDVNFGLDSSGAPTFGNFGLSHVWSGITSAFTWSAPAWSVVLGGTASDYHRDHSLAMRPDLDTPLYFNTGVKRDAAAFLKTTWVHGPLRLGADVHSRYTRFRYQPSANAGIYPQPVTWSFINPKLGATWNPGGRWNAYLTAGRTWREPARSDFLAGADDLNRDNANDIVPFSQVRAEKVDDYEGGIVRRGARTRATINLFAMEFHNEIAPIGELALTGAPLRRNVPRSFRRGLELEAEMRLARGGAIAGNLAWMRARIETYDDKSAGVIYHDIEPLLTPPIMGNLRWDAPAWRGVSPAISVRYVDRMHLANDGNPQLVVPASTLVDAALAWERGPSMVRVEVRNLLGADVHSGGYTDGQARYFYPVATRNLLVTVRRSLGGWAANSRRE